MTNDPTKDHADYGLLRAGGAYATQHFEEATELDDVDPSADIASNELHSPEDEVCAKCGNPIAAGVDMRKTFGGGMVHETCP